jgi:hypothetical protein
MLPQTPISAVDCVGPALEWTKRAMLRPFRWAKWWRVGLLGAAVGELSSFSCNVNGGDWNEIMRKHPQQFQSAASPFPTELFMPIFVTLFVSVIVLVFVHMYVASVLRFVYFDAVATGRFRLREGWSRWHSRGLRWFVFNLLLLLAFLALVTIIAVPAILLGVGIHKVAGGVGTVLLILVGIPIGLLLLLCLACAGVLLKDFAIPLMALEDITPFTAFKRVLTTAWHRKGEHAGYLGMKIVLAIGFGIATAIVETILLVILIIPIVVLVIAGGVLGASQGSLDPQRIFQNPVLIAGIVTVFVFVFFAVMALASLILAPGLFFFEAYVLTWLAQRYEPLWNLLYPAPPQPPAAPITEPIPPTEPPPLPAM